MKKAVNKEVTKLDMISLRGQAPSKCRHDRWYEGTCWLARWRPGREKGRMQNGEGVGLEHVGGVLHHEGDLGQGFPVAVIPY